MSKLADLIRLGFEPITTWVLAEGRIKLDSLKWQDHGGWLYAFIVDDEVQYIGLTNRVLRSRMDDYRHLKLSQTSRVRALILQELEAGGSVAIYGCKHADAGVMAAEELRLRNFHKPIWNLI